eukprot:CAMPEP_0175191586 /NCGR_PEP_ID=MMETSP0093-20121207/5019_1 /TAXON_ID=311494 /ORGANISM="Alexandrium monilatum, Strain CCMP3105" /LENGTH=109 /DNA_ID=CAMNT_0016484415 /DNA_START=249 /DNA_END=578 /DNA_ORIENTATION=+
MVPVSPASVVRERKLLAAPQLPSGAVYAQVTERRALPQQAVDRGERLALDDRLQVTPPDEEERLGLREARAEGGAHVVPRGSAVCNHDLTPPTCLERVERCKDACPHAA